MVIPMWKANKQESYMFLVPGPILNKSKYYTIEIVYQGVVTWMQGRKALSSIPNLWKPSTQIIIDHVFLPLQCQGGCVLSMTHLACGLPVWRACYISFLLQFLVWCISRWLKSTLVKSQFILIKGNPENLLLVLDKMGNLGTSFGYIKVLIAVKIIFLAFM